MKKFMWVAVGCTALLWSSVSSAQPACPGDCNDDNTVAINELSTCVNIALETSAVSTCPTCDVNGDGMVAINELIAAVGVALLPSCPGIGNPTCGDSTMDSGEECDDGNNFGGDGCAANCTTGRFARRRVQSGQTIAVVQTGEAIPITLNLTGQQTFRTGRPRPRRPSRNGGTISARRDSGGHQGPMSCSSIRSASPAWCAPACAASRSIVRPWHLRQRVDRPATPA
jgi:cysteine-rich repeat protein